MFDYVITSLAAEIHDLILTLPTETPYDILKETLIERTPASDQRHLQQLFSAEELGDRKPTQLLCRLQQLASNIPSRIVFTMTAQFNVRIVLASTQSNTPINKLAQLAYNN